MLDTATISTSTMAKNYSHCPLKKRPIQFVDAEEEPPMKKQQIESLPTIVDCRKIRIPTPPPVKIGRFLCFNKIFGTRVLNPLVFLFLP